MWEQAFADFLSKKAGIENKSVSMSRYKRHEVMSLWKDT